MELPDGAGRPVVRRHVVISGRVQGVWFRESCRRAARNLHVTGWVRNRADGTVEAAFEGAETDVAAVVAWCEQGPPRASVERVDVFVELPQGETTFEVR